MTDYDQLHVAQIAQEASLVGRPEAIGERVLAHIQIPPESTDAIRARDQIEPEYIGTRPMIVTRNVVGNEVPSFGRRAPRYSTGDPSHY